MEELLNKLIKRGWHPFGWDDKLSSLHKEFGVGKRYIRFHNGMDSELFDLRQLTSKESGLWQFVCENKLVKTKDKKVRYRYEDLERTQNYFSWYGYKYRIIESALKDESELEQFLIDNIKIEGKLKNLKKN